MESREDNGSKYPGSIEQILFSKSNTKCALEKTGQASFSKNGRRIERGEKFCSSCYLIRSSALPLDPFIFYFAGFAKSLKTFTAQIRHQNVMN